MDHLLRKARINERAILLDPNKNRCISVFICQRKTGQNILLATANNGQIKRVTQLSKNIILSQLSGCQNAKINRRAALQPLHQEGQHRQASQIGKRLSRKAAGSALRLKNDSNLICHHACPETKSHRLWRVGATPSCGSSV